MDYIANVRSDLGARKVLWDPSTKSYTTSAINAYICASSAAFCSEFTAIQPQSASNRVLGTGTAGIDVPAAQANTIRRLEPRLSAATHAGGSPGQPDPCTDSIVNAYHHIGIDDGNE